MKILIIDDSRDFRSLARLYLGRKLPDAEVVEYEVEKLGKPDPGFRWGEYDVLLLDYNLGGGANGFSWLKEFSRNPGFPPTIILTAEGDEYIAVKAIKMGAADYMNKVDITPGRLAEVIQNAVDYTDEKIVEQEKEKIQDESLVKQLATEKSVKPGKKDISTAYRFVRLIGQGAMSKVYLAERESDNSSLVLKILQIDANTNENAVKRFIQEAELVAGLNSPFVVKIFDYGMTNAYAYIAVEFFSRGDLKQRMELRLPPEIALSYMIHIGYGLQAIHDIGIVHRDLKPANVMFRGDDSLALADFGISKKLNSTSDLTTLGQILGTPHYMSPEQAEGREIDQRSDIYSAGILLYELLTRKKPFTATTPAALIYQHVHSPIPHLPASLSVFQEVIDSTMAKNPADRYQSAGELINKLESIESESN
ncbi:MAG TPA: protein kinase [Gammaproteobacteria bacterium]|nr:protein kinase [Gammaproteobacteria bacterium]